MTFTDKLLGSIDARIAQANEQISALHGALAALDGDGAGRANGDGAGRANGDGGTPPAPEPVAASPVARIPRKPRTSRPARARRTNVVLLPDALAALLRDSEQGLSASAIAKQTGAAYSQVLETLRVLERDGEVRQSGTRRSSVWRVLSDEERIAERAAELERRRAAS